MQWHSIGAITTQCNASNTEELSPDPHIHRQNLRSPGMTLSSDINKLSHQPGPASGQTFYVTEIRFYDSIPSPVIDNICQLFWVRWVIMLQWSAVSKELMKITNDRPHCITKNFQSIHLSSKWIYVFLLESVEHFQSYIWWRNYLMIDQILENVSSLFPDINLVTISETSNED